MDEIDRAAKQLLMDELDARIISPETRSEKVYAILQKHAPNLTQWDIICFAVNYLGFASSGIEWLKLPAKHIARLVYTAHYMDPQTNNESGIEQKSNGDVAGKIESQSPKEEPLPLREPPRRLGGFDVSGGGFE